MTKKLTIAIIGAAGKEGSLLVKEAIARGHEVTAIVRNASKVDAPEAKVLEKDLFKLNYEDLKKFDVVIDAFGAWTEDTLPLHQSSLKYLADLLSGKPNRLLVVGGAGSLYVDPQHKTRLIDTPDFPDMFKPLASIMSAAFDALKVRNDVNWTYVSPSANFVADGIRTGEYISGGEELMVNSIGESVISYADYAIAMIDEAENATHLKKRYTVVSK
ncbi:NAD(P)-dependent oxidoreductase [Candidatus Clostridium radicumherbarum]|uniref:NAD(P)-dependent oxidoreductase n=1 Tax=Candidatus Clostridium radicumherbarum TaxID=3381662 RepID=A0ABW8TU29_9CLOT